MSCSLQKGRGTTPDCVKTEKKRREEKKLSEEVSSGGGQARRKDSAGTSGGEGQGGGREMERSGRIGSVFVKEITRLAVWGEGEERVEDSPSSLL